MSVTVYKWLNDSWVGQATIPLTAGEISGNPDTHSAVTTADLSGSLDPDFLIHSTVADKNWVSVISDENGPWRAIPILVGYDVVTSVDAKAVRGDLLEGEMDSCLNSCAEGPKTYVWYSYNHDEFQPTDPPGPVPPCTVAYFSTLMSSSASGGKLVFNDVACNNGWALSKGTLTFTNGSGSEAGIGTTGLILATIQRRTISQSSCCRSSPTNWG